MALTPRIPLRDHLGRWTVKHPEITTLFELCQLKLAQFETCSVGCPSLLGRVRCQEVTVECQLVNSQLTICCTRAAGRSAIA